MDLENNNLVSINGEEIPTLEILMMLTILMILPSLLTMVTSFVRIIIILSFTRNAIGIPPNMVLVGIALFLTLFIMQPVIEQVNTEVYTPYKKGELTQTEALKEAQVPIKEFMLEHTEKSTFKLFVEMSGQEIEEEPRDQSLIVIIPAFMTSELKRGFTAGLLLYIPFLLLDIIVSSTLMSMGMIMLPPATIALPFKVLLFVSVDGWELLFSSIVKSFS